MKVKDLGERKLIALIAGLLASSSARRGNGHRVLVGIGDDAAVIKSAGNTLWVFTTDTMASGVHFLVHREPPLSIGYKALVSASSDVVAMGGRPLFAVVSASLTGYEDIKWVRQFTQGLRRASSEYGIRVVGGETTRSLRDIVVCVTVLGTLFRKPITRSGARKGDIVMISGVPGQAHLGAEYLSRGTGGFSRRCVRKYLYPRLHIDLAHMLATRARASSLIDTSDGLDAALRQISAASRKRLDIILPAIPALSLRRRFIRSYAASLYGAEDYDLVFTLPSKSCGPVARSFRGCVPIGEVREGRGVRYYDGQGTLCRIPPGGYEHFKTGGQQP